MDIASRMMPWQRGAESSATETQRPVLMRPRMSERRRVAMSLEPLVQHAARQRQSHELVKPARAKRLEHTGTARNQIRHPLLAMIKLKAMTFLESVVVLAGNGGEEGRKWIHKGGGCFQMNRSAPLSWRTTCFFAVPFSPSPSGQKAREDSPYVMRSTG